MNMLTKTLECIENINHHIGTHLFSRSFSRKLLAALLVVCMILTGFYGLQLTTHSTDVHAASTDARTATSTSDCVNDTSVGTRPWSNPGNAANVGSNATVSHNASATTNYLKCTNFGFSGLIPSGSTIDGITMTVKRSRGIFGTVIDSSVRIIKNGTIGSTNKSSATNWPVTLATTNYGGSSDLWGETWSIADIESSSFGAAISAAMTYSSINVQANVDYIQLTVHYTAPAVTIDQSGYRIFANDDSTNVGSPLAALNTPAVLNTTGQAFRLRALAHVADNPLHAGESFNLQYVDPGSGTCMAPTGGTPSDWANVTQSGTGSSWIEETSNSNLPSTGTPALANLNGTLFLYDPQNKTMYTSSDGVHWTTVNPPPGDFIETKLLVYDDKVWIIGGVVWPGGSPSLSNAVYYTTDGLNYTQATASANWTARYGHTVATFDGKMWIAGGSDSLSTYSAVNDVWYSVDGATWTQATANSSWSARLYHEMISKDDLLWIMGGTLDGTTVYNDTWYSADGVTWTQATGSAAWAARIHFGLVIKDDEFVVLGGASSFSTTSGLGDIWKSADGVSWNLVTDSPPWPARQFPGASIFDNQIWLFGGILASGTGTNEIWHTQDSSLITYNDNVTPATGSTLTTNANDPTHSGHTVAAQTYNEESPGGMSAQVPVGQDGLWDFSLIDNGAPAGTTYCFRMVYDDGTEFDSYSHYPTIITFGGELPTPQIQMHQRMRSGNWWNDGVRQLLHLD